MISQVLALATMGAILRQAQTAMAVATNQTNPVKLTSATLTGKNRTTTNSKSSLGAKVPSIRETCLHSSTYESFGASGLQFVL